MSGRKRLLRLLKGDVNENSNDNSNSNMPISVKQEEEEETPREEFEAIIELLNKKKNPKKNKRKAIDKLELFFESQFPIFDATEEQQIFS